MGRAPCCQRVKGEKKGPWTHEEDLRLTRYIEANGEGQWRTIPLKAGLDRCGKGCRLRWMNYLRPNMKRGNISKEEEELIIRLYKLLGNRWSLIAGRVPGRTDNDIKNYWNTHLSKTYNKERRTNFESSANHKDPFSTNSLEKSEAQNVQVVGEITETEPETGFVSDFELQHLNCYYNLLNPSLENQGESWSSLNPTVEAWSGDIDGSWTQLGFVDLSSSPCLFDLSNPMQPTSLSGFEYDGFRDFCVQNQHVESTNSSVIDLSLFPPACFSAFIGLGQPELASFGDFQLETMALLTGQMELGVDHYDGLETMMRNQFFLDGIM